MEITILGYTKSPNSEDLYCSGTYGSYKASDSGKVKVNEVPVISIPSRITVTDDDGNKVVKKCCSCLHSGN